MIKVAGKTINTLSLRERVIISAKLQRRGLMGDQINTAFKTLNGWIDSPGPPGDVAAKIASGEFEPVFLKEFTDSSELVSALAGHTLAVPNRIKEERLAFAVLENLALYEIYVLDPVLKAITREYKGKKLWTKSYYGIAALPKWVENSIEKTLPTLQGKPPLERLYMKVALIHDTLRALKKYSPGRNDHSNMRRGKWTLNESHATVAADRSEGVSVWGGTSGSAMDMIHYAQTLDILDESQLTALAWCIAAFFHFMPTAVSPTHTWHEVMRGAHKIIGIDMVGYDPTVFAIPDIDFAGMHLKKARYWQPDSESSTCNGCNQSFSFWRMKHHCRNCGYVFCDSCTKNRAKVKYPAQHSQKKENQDGALRVCNSCFDFAMAEIGKGKR
jgi:hypothetical protein